VTFPLHWANTCCSHPLTDIEGEAEEEGHMGVKRAAQRKLEHELGIPPASVPLDSFTFMTRVHYLAAADDGVWGEAEVDTVLICRPPAGNVPLAVNDNEVAAVRWLRRDELADWIATADRDGVRLSKWFRLIATSVLPQWWGALAGDDLASAVEEGVIYRADTLEAQALVREVMPVAARAQ
jgi:isopentenyl-diphosphate delta-isomerase